MVNWRGCALHFPKHHLRRMTMNPRGPKPSPVLPFTFPLVSCKYSSVCENHTYIQVTFELTSILAQWLRSIPYHLNVASMKMNPMWVPNCSTITKHKSSLQWSQCHLLATKGNHVLVNISITRGGDWRKTSVTTFFFSLCSLCLLSNSIYCSSHFLFQFSFGPFFPSGHSPSPFCI